MIKKGIQRLVKRKNLTSEETAQIMKEIMSGETTPAQISAFLTALRMKGETIREVTSLIQVMRQFATKIKPKVTSRILDIVGTGGDKIKTVNVSTTAAIVSAGAGATVAKHGNRSFTSKCGAADILERFGVNITADPSLIEKSIETVGIGFLFAPIYHPAMKHVVAPRREIGVRTVFNILGPLTNPAGADAMLVGVYDPALVEPVANVLAKLGLKEALVVHGLDGLDEISTIGKTSAAWMKGNEVKITQFLPNDFGVEKAKPEMLIGNNVEENAKIIFRMLNGHLKENNRLKELVMVNAAAGIAVAGLADNLLEGMSLAKKSIVSGDAYGKLQSMVNASEGDKSKLEELESRFC
jgi:anthranilate phosphoribosyltransferase